jgi:hypothetical protein
MSESQDELKAKAWNESIVPNLEMIRAWFSMDAYTKGVLPYLKYCEARFLDKLISSEDRTREQERFLAGEIAYLREFLAMPKAIENNIRIIADKPKQDESRNPITGY